MRLLISGSKRNANTIGAFIINNMDRDVDYEVLEFPDQFLKLLESKLYRTLYHLFPILIVWRMDKLFVQQVKRFKPTVILVFKGVEISKRSLIQIRKLGVSLVNYNFDHPFIHFSRGTGNQFVTEAIPYYDLHISYSSIIAKKLSERFKVATAVIPFGFHLDQEQYNHIVDLDTPEIREICFVGNPDALRVKAMKEILGENLRVHVYGFGWEKYIGSSELFVIHPPQKLNSFWSDPLEFWKVLRQYRVQLNFFRPHNEGSHNLRTFEVPAVGGILVTPDSPEQRHFFESEREVFFFTNNENLISLCRRLLAMDEKEVSQIRQQARKKSVGQDYSYKRRTDDLLTLLKALMREN